VPLPLPRSYRHQEQARDEAKLARILAEVGDEQPSSSAGATSGGDESRLRGVPGSFRRD
jgi:hypothetical protein